MNPVTVVALLNWFLLPALVLAAPTSNRPQALRQALDETKTVVDKVLEDVKAAYAATVTLPVPTITSGLDRMREKLVIPSAPVIKPLSETFSLDLCVTQLLAGVQLHQDLLAALSTKVEGLRRLNSDIRDLKLRIHKVKEVEQLSGASGSDQNSSSDLASRLHTDYDVQVALHLTLTQLQSFCQDVTRSLRNIKTAYRL